MLRTLVIYSSKYGSTEDAAKIIALVTGPAVYCGVEEFKPEYIDFDFIVIGSPIYQEKLEPSINEFISNNSEWLKEKPVSLFCTCLDKNGGLEQLNSLEKSIDIKVLSKKAVGGRLIIDKLDEEDHGLIKEFLKTVNLPFDDMDFYSKEEIVNYAMKLKSLKEKLIIKLDEDKVIGAVEEFLTSHNTCTLATSYSNRVRSTPIEYNYLNGYIYLLSEGGVKFANLVLNKNVSIAVYEDYTGMNNLKGMQISGHATMIDDEDEEYARVLKLKGLNLDIIKSMPTMLNMIKITVEKVEFLNSEFRGEGADAKQIINY